ncbi:L-lysine cyclodeaminase [Variibacter gotjawalensis]|uniref:L-lysine cyclodeaminase n=1 Tax=Variibacter gotjawalensis TaxID=1333996 RepID=A0A0S3Q0L2_9BRAD|nr:ornithine cyclodeaminase family protein [Variibacter gotjawalensis]NIK47557.1 ornithine cyclodeaminase [Variibacter gotjawalensis]RZS49454.1 ornithine cyclodeaminase [Variibacter gotjawalensis]BAT61717.1 L-lysine cyclodeaminase [Variibacter gotjawalensis]
MRIITAQEVAATLTFPALIAALSSAFRGNFTVPVRHHHTLDRPTDNATLLLMPAWGAGRDGTPYVGTKMVTVFPENVARGEPSVYGNYFLLAGDSGAPLAVIDGPELTAWRTAAASALAAKSLAHEDASHLTMIGAGALAAKLVRAHASVRPIRRVTLWNRGRERAEQLAHALRDGDFAITIADDREAAVRDADIVSCATLTRTPLIEGAWLKPGAHVDLVGGFTPEMREADDETIRRAGIYVDTRAGATKEAGDIVQPLVSGLLKIEDIRGDLFDLSRGKASGRKNKDEITLFKSVGTAIEDLAAAILLWEQISVA